jgi:hypothetical protein
MRRTGTRLAGWASRWGFAALVGLGAVVGLAVAASVDPPAEIPSFALQATAVYRVEVGAVLFAAIYLTTMALVLALNNRAFSEIGMSGIKAQSLSGATQNEESFRLELVEMGRRIDALCGSSTGEEGGRMERNVCE